VTEVFKVHPQCKWHGLTAKFKKEKTGGAQKNQNQNK